MQSADTKTVEFDVLPDGRRLFLHVGWVDGSDTDGLKFWLTCGAGVGNPYMKLAVLLPDGRRVEETVDIREGVKAWVNRIVAEAG